MFRAVCYRPDECQIITGGTDRKIGYWETYDGSQIRELDGSKAESINGMDIHGKYFVTGGGDKLIKVNIIISAFLYYIQQKIFSFFLHTAPNCRCRRPRHQYMLVP